MMRFSALASVIATVLIGPLQAPAQAQETIRIGVLEPMTGPANKRSHRELHGYGNRPRYDQ